MQVKIHRLLLKSRFRTKEKEEADFFFVPAYVKCVHMLEGLTEEEINQTYVQVLHQSFHTFFFFTYSLISKMSRYIDKKKCIHGFQVLSQMPYFRRSGGRDHIFVFPRYQSTRFIGS